MPLKQFTTDFRELGKDPYLRNDEKYHAFLYFSNWNLFDVKNKNLVSLKDILIDDYHNFEYEEGEEYKGIPTGQTYLDEDGYMKEFQPVTAEDHPGRLKYKVSNDNVLISSLRLAKSPALYFENEDLSDYVFSNGFYIYKIKEGWSKKFILYILRTKRLKDALDNHIYRGIGISAYKDEDLKKIKIPLIPKPKQDQIVAQIEPIEKKIKELKSQIVPPQEIINKVFAREFGFDLEKFEELKKEKFFETDFSKISKNNLSRFSSHFHHIKLDLLENKLKDKDFWTLVTTKFKLSGGKRIPKGKTFSNDETGYYYLRPTEINIWGIDKKNVPYISLELYNELKRYRIKTGEFCISIVGTLGKTALVNTEELEIENENLILSENFIKLTPIQEINELFYYYYFYSFIFEAQADREYTITSIKKLGIDKWNYIKIPNISLKTQQKIVDKIKAELDKQEEINKKIRTKRSEIDHIIEKAIK
jgi:type I restriction enzyme S subunit